MNNIIIVGAGTVGLELMDRLNNTILIEADPAKYTIAHRQHPDWQVIGGDARQPDVLMRAGIEAADALVLVTNKDYVNWKIALSAGEFSVRKVVTRIRDESYRQKLKEAGVTHIISPVRETIDAIHQEVFPTMETITDISITRDSPMLNSRIRDIKLPRNCVIAGLRKGQNLQKVEPGMILKAGDVISLVSLGDLDTEIFETLTGSSSPFILRKGMLFLLLGSDDMGALKEAAYLCLKSGVDCQIVYRHENSALRMKAASLLEKVGVRGIFKPIIGNILEEFRKLVVGLGDNSGVLVVLHQARKGLLGHKLPVKFVRNLIESSNATILFARGHRYDRILHLLDSNMVGKTSSKCAVSMALDTSTRLHAMCPHSTGSAEHDIVRSHTRRMARIHGIDVVEDIVLGNPHIEFLVKVREKANQLVIVNWHSSFLQRDILVRIINDSEASVLVVAGQEKL